LREDDGFGFDLSGKTLFITGASRDIGLAIGLGAARIIADLNERGAKVVIAQHPRRTRKSSIDVEMYKWRHLIENFFGELKEFKRIAMRADKTDSSFKAIIHLAAAVINSR
jgi:transposase